MILIKKYSPPPELLSLQAKAKRKGKNPKEAYDMLRNPLKQKVRDRLVEEQGQLCAYCMCRIPRDDVEVDISPITIEHFIAKNLASGMDFGQGLDYNNFLAVCHGNRGPHGTRSLADLTCDAHRENTYFRKINPTNSDTLQSIFYHLDGSIDADDKDVRFDLVETLNLNCPTAPLLKERKAALNTLILNLGNIDSEDLLSYCEDFLNNFEAETLSKTPYVGILTWYIQDLISVLKE